MKIFTLWFVPPIVAGLVGLFIGVVTAIVADKWLRTYNLIWLFRFILIVGGLYALTRTTAYFVLPDRGVSTESSMRNLFLVMFVMALQGSVYIAAGVSLISGLISLFRRQ